MWETWVQSLGWEGPLEKGMATHSSMLTWRIPMDSGAWRAAVHGVKRVGHNWATRHICMRKGKILNSWRKVEPREEEGQVALRKKWMTWGWLLAISFIFVPITYSELLPCLSTNVEFWLLASSRSQQCNSRKRRQDWLPHSWGMAGASWLSLQVVQAISPTSALPFWLPTV